MCDFSSLPTKPGWPVSTGLIADGQDDASFAALRAAEQTGGPLGNPDFIEGLERVLRRPIGRRAPGRKALPRSQGFNELGTDAPVTLF